MLSELCIRNKNWPCLIASESLSPLFLPCSPTLYKWAILNVLRETKKKRERETLTSQGRQWTMVERLSGCGPILKEGTWFAHGDLGWLLRDMFFQRYLELQSGNSRGEKKLGDGIENGGHLSQKSGAGSRRAICDLTSLRKNQELSFELRQKMSLRGCPGWAQKHSFSMKVPELRAVQAPNQRPDPGTLGKRTLFSEAEDRPVLHG